MYLFGGGGGGGAAGAGNQGSFYITQETNFAAD